MDGFAFIELFNVYISFIKVVNNYFLSFLILLRGVQSGRMPSSMSPDEFRAAAHQVVDWMADYLRDIRDYPVLPDVQPGELIDRLSRSGPERGEPMEAILEDFRKLIVPGITHWGHPRFHAYFSISGSGPGILGEMLAAALNVNHMLWKT